MSIEPLFISADQVRPGDTIRWCDRTITIIAIEPVGSPYNRRPGVHLIESAQRRLHYYADEMVELADG